MVYHPAEMVPARFVTAEFQQQGSLGKLPAEVRNRIFHSALTARFGLMVFGGLHRGYKHNVAVGLLSTCQQFFQEGRYIFYNDNMLVFENQGCELIHLAEMRNITYKGPILPPRINLGISVTSTCIKFMTLHLGDNYSQEDGCHKVEQFIRSLDSMRNTIQVQELTLSFCIYAWDWKVKPAMLARALTKFAVVNCVTVEAPTYMWYDEDLGHFPEELGMYNQPISIGGNLSIQDYFHCKKVLEEFATGFLTRGFETYYRNIAVEVAVDDGVVNNTGPDDGVAEVSGAVVAE